MVVNRTQNPGVKINFIFIYRKQTENAAKQGTTYNIISKCQVCLGIDLKKKMFWYNLVNQLYISKKKGVLYMEKNDKTIETGCKQVERYIVFVN